MRLPHSEESRGLQVLDRYLSLQAGDLFDDATHAEVPRPDATHTSAPRHPRSALIGFLVASAALVLVMLGQAGMGELEMPGLRGAPGQLEGVSEWRGNAVLDLAWNSMPEASHYSLRVWDLRGGPIASRVVDGLETFATIGVRPDAPRPLFWTVVAWKGTRRLAASEVLTSMPAE